MVSFTGLSTGGTGNYLLVYLYMYRLRLLAYLPWVLVMTC